MTVMAPPLPPAAIRMVMLLRTRSQVGPLPGTSALVAGDVIDGGHFRFVHCDPYNLDAEGRAGDIRRGYGYRAVTSIRRRRQIINRSTPLRQRHWAAGVQEAPPLVLNSTLM